MPTGHSRQIDFVYVSPELLPFLRDVIVDHSQWSDHASVQGVFAGSPSQLETFHWRMPRPVEWPAVHKPIILPEIGDPSESFAKLWHTAEQEVSKQLKLGGGSGLTPAQCGRAQTVNTERVVPFLCPLRKSRSNEVQPTFTGVSCRFAQQFKQVRRFQSLVKTLRRSPIHPSLNPLWHAIRHSTGFPGGFCFWWRTVGWPKFGGPPEIPFALPALSVCEHLFHCVQQWVDAFGNELKLSRLRLAKRRRQADLHYLFKDCARDPPKQVDILVHTKHAEVVDYDWQANTIELDRPSPFNFEAPLVVGGHAMALKDQYDNELAVEALAPMDPGDTIRQTKVITDVSAVLEAFCAEWEPRWSRLDHLQDSQWDQIIRFAEVSLAPIPWNFPDILPDQFVKSVASKKRAAAVGPDGISRQDILKLSPMITPASLAFYRHAEGTGLWPKQLTLGIVSLLKKSRDALDVRQYRPVVVYPLTYRVWSSIRGRQFLRALGSHRPEGMRGGMPKCQAKSVWYEMAMLLEASHAASSSLIGIVADLEKAFNNIPRLPVWSALKVMNCPDHVIRGWGGFVNAQARRFKVRQSLSRPIFSTCGYPEGCALSIGAMAIIDLLLDHWLKGVFPKIRCLTYVDDWQFVHEHIAQHSGVVDHLGAFVSAVSMKLDAKKTYVWATTCQDRTDLRHGGFAVVHNARSLGAHMTYTRQRGNRTVVDRINDMDFTWRLLKASVAPYFRKLQALKQLAWPRALHAVSGSPIARSHFGKLRTGAVRGLRSNRVGTSPMLHLVGQGLLHDPEIWAVWQTFKDARDYGDNTLFLSNISMLVGDKNALPSNGPTSVLVHRCELLGWTALSTGFFQDEIGTFNLLEIPIDSLRFRLSVAIPQLLAREVSHRKCFEGIHQVDLVETHRLVSKYASADRVFLVCSLDGTMYTRQGHQHWNEIHDNQCPFCQERDGFAHRLWECSHFQRQRDLIPPVFRDFIASFPECARCHGWPIRPPTHFQLLQVLDSIEDVPIASYRLQHCQGPVIDLFTDGTCLCPDNPNLRLASWAICVAKPWINEWEQEIIASGWVSGLQQTAFRAELLALVHSTRIAGIVLSHFRVWTDCLSLADCIRRIQHFDFVWTPNMAHGDLWQELVISVQALGNRFQIFHVFSHIPPSLGGTSAEQWIFWHNGLVDKAAELANSKRGEAFWNLWDKCAADQQFFRQCFGYIADLIIATGRSAERDTKTPEVPAQVLPTVSDVAVPQAEGNVLLPEVVVRKYGYGAVKWLHSWWLETGDCFLRNPRDLKWISFLQLYVDFSLATGQEAPFLYQGRWFFGSRFFPGEVLPDFAAQSRWFQMMVKRYWDANKLPVRVKSTRPASSAVICWMVCALLPWSDDRLAKVDQVIRGNFGGIIKKGVSVRELTRVEQHVPWAITPPNVGFRG